MATAPQASTRDLIKDVARRLFVERGVDNVSVRDILSAANQKNVGAIGYYFQSKDALVEEILAEGARAIDARRNEMLDQLEAEAAAIDLHAILKILIASSLDDSITESGTLLRFFSVFQARDNSTFHRIVANHHDRGFRRCIDHIRTLVPGLARETLNQRIMFMMLMTGTSLALYEASRDSAAGQPSSVYGGQMWASPHVIDNLIDAAAGLIAAR